MKTIILQKFVCKRQAIKVINIGTSINFDLRKKNSFFVLKHVVRNYEHWFITHSIYDGVSLMSSQS